MADLSLRFEVRGAEELAATLSERAPELARQALKVALYQEGEAVMTASKRIVPVRTGALRSSGIVSQPTESGNRVEVRLGYGGAAAPYAVYVHERLDLRHKPPTSAKFLERPLLERAFALPERIAEGLARAFERLRRRVGR